MVKKMFFSDSRVSECHVKNCLEINHTKSVLLSEESEYVNFQNSKDEQNLCLIYKKRNFAQLRGLCKLLHFELISCNF